MISYKTPGCPETKPGSEMFDRRGSATATGMEDCMSLLVTSDQKAWTSRSPAPLSPPPLPQQLHALRPRSSCGACSCYCNLHILSTYVPQRAVGMIWLMFLAHTRTLHDDRHVTVPTDTYLVQSARTHSGPSSSLAAAGRYESPYCPGMCPHRK